MSTATKNTFQFLWPYIVGLLIIRLGIDFIIKSLAPTLGNANLGQIIALVLELVFIFLAINNYKKFVKAGELLFTDGIKIGVGLILVFGIIFSAYVVIHGAYIDPSYQITLAKEFAKNAGQKYQEVEDSMAFRGFAFSVIRYIFIGAFGSVICSAILKTEK